MSGPGLISERRAPGPNMTALLYNFDVNSPVLKPEHVIWIRQTLFPWTTVRDVSVLVVGLTSRTGTDALNMKLSEARAGAVSRELFLMSPKMPVETKVFLGERAAALVGMDDNVESERWRAVWIQVADARVPVQLPQPRFVQRRTAVTLLLKEEQKNFGGQSEPGERAYQAAQAFRRARGWNNGEVGDKKQLVDESFILTGITLEKSSRSDGIPIVSTYETEYLHIRYEWGPWDGKSSRWVTFTRKKWMQAKGPPKDQVTTVNPVVGEDWLTRPMWAYQNI